MVNIPQNWPSSSGITYKNTVNYQGSNAMKTQHTLKDFVYIKKISDKTHPLYGQYGVFAQKGFRQYDILGQYTGNLVRSDLSKEYKGSLYTAFLCESYDINADRSGNETRFINDYRDIQEKPNVALRTGIVNKKPVVLFICCNDISPGDEILTDYGTQYWESLRKAK